MALGLAWAAQAQVLVYTGTISGALNGKGRTERISEKCYFVVADDGSGATLIAYGKETEGKYQDTYEFTSVPMPFQPLDIEPGTFAHREVLGPKGAPYAEVAFRSDSVDDEFEPYSFAAYFAGPVSPTAVDIGFPLGPAASATATVAKSLSGYALFSERDEEEDGPLTMADDDDDGELDPFLATGLLALRFKFDLKLTRFLNSSETIGGMPAEAVLYLQQKLDEAGYPLDPGGDDDWP
jgi:hypothetical protein